MMSSPPVAAFVAGLRRFQRRLRLRAFFRHAFLAVAIATACDAAFVSFARIDNPAILVASSLVLAVLAAYGWAVRRTASLPATARIVDRELKLQDRATSALEFLHGTDAVSRLVVADASSRLELLPVSSLPLSVPRSSRRVAALTALSALIFMVLASSMRESPTGVTSSASGRPDRASADVDGRSPRPSAAQPAARAAGDGREPRVAAPSSDLQPTPPMGMAADAAKTTAANRDPRDVTLPKDVTSPDAVPSSAPERTGLRPGTDAAASSRNDPRANTPPGSTANSALSARGQGARAPSTAQAGGGGISGGALADKPAGVSRSARTGGSRRQSTPYAMAHARAEAALATEHIPVGLRSYVRAYFVAIRPSPKQ